MAVYYSVVNFTLPFFPLLAMAIRDYHTTSTFLRRLPVSRIECCRQKHQNNLHTYSHPHRLGVHPQRPTLASSDHRARNEAKMPYEPMAYHRFPFRRTPHGPSRMSIRLWLKAHRIILKQSLTKTVGTPQTKHLLVPIADVRPASTFSYPQQAAQSCRLFSMIQWTILLP